MSTIWIVSEDPVLRGTLEVHLGPEASVWTGAPERGDWKDVGAPDLLVLAATDSEMGDLRGLERMLEFVAFVPHPRRAAPPVLYVPAASGHPPLELASALFDDRPFTALEWPFDPHRLAATAREILARGERPASLRERAQREWVGRRVELFYAGVDLPALRTAVDPRNAARPVLLAGESGTRRGLIARYIHQLAEPVREELIVLPAAALPLHGVERHVLGLTAGRRITAYVARLDEAAPAIQAEVGHLLAQSGAVAIEPIRWIASCTRPARLHAEARGVPWIEVALPPLRERADRRELAEQLIDLLSGRTRGSVRLDEEALTLIEDYGWPGNLGELEAVLEGAIHRASGAIIGARDLRLGARARTAPVRPGERIAATDEGEGFEEEEAVAEGAIGADGIDVGGIARDGETAVLALEDERREEAARPAAIAAPPTTASTPIGSAPFSLGDLLPPLAQEIREPLLAIRTYASLLDQRPDDDHVRKELGALVERDAAHLEASLQRLEQFAHLGPPRRELFDLAHAVQVELDLRSARMRQASLVVLRELDLHAPSLEGDEEQLGFVLGALLDRALRMVPEGGDLYVATLFQEADFAHPARHRILIRFHSPEEVLVAPDDAPGPAQPLEVVMARVVLGRMGGTFAVDVSGPQDNVILIELPARMKP